ncbi:MAG: agmatine deiminase family protein, partial [Chrysiogenetes bacterium]|nr:agmatine deiminase family protein [Chrysiogenetes bacterium]
MSESLSLSAQGWRMPAEWEPHEATWLSWPHNPKTWPGRDFTVIEDIWAQMAAALAPGEIVNILASERLHERVHKALSRRSVPEDRIRLHDVPTNDVWARDHGPIFLVRDENGTRERLILNWDYNAWGGKFPPWDDDNRVPARVSEITGIAHVTPGMILEGGSIDVNGRGCLLTTEQCLLNKNRNPSLTREQIEQRLRDHLGATNILWLHDGLEGDDTDGHVDDITRFVSERVIVTTMCEDTNDANHVVLLENR